jgi:hypothetical protein
MRYFYKKENSDFYESRFIDNPVFWWDTTLVVTCVGSYVLAKGIRSNYLEFLVLIFGLGFVGLSFWQAYQVKKYLGSFKRFCSYLVNFDLVQRLDTALLNARSKGAMRAETYRVLPKIWLYYENNAFHLKVEKLPGSYSEDLDHLGELISSTLGDRYFLTSKQISRDESWFLFVCSKLEKNLQWTPSSRNFRLEDPYHVRLMADFTLEFEKLPHLAVFGATGSRKTTTLIAILLQELGRSECYFLDGKSEFSALKSFMSDKYFAESEDEILALMNHLLKIMNERKKILAEEVKKRGKMGLTAHDIGLPPVFLFVDEYASVKARCSKSKELDRLMLQALMQFRSLGMYVVYASQSPSTTVLSTQMREAFSTYVLLGTANGDTQRMTFGQTVTTGTVPTGWGYYLSKVATMPTPQLFVVPNLVKNNLESLELMEKLYKEKVA